jgi:hypothetical protein
MALEFDGLAGFANQEDLGTFGLSTFTMTILDSTSRGGRLCGSLCCIHYKPNS